MAADFPVGSSRREPDLSEIAFTCPLSGRDGVVPLVIAAGMPQQARAQDNANGFQAQQIRDDDLLLQYADATLAGSVICNDHRPGLPWKQGRCPKALNRLPKTVYVRIACPWHGRQYVAANILR